MPIIVAVSCQQVFLTLKRKNLMASLDTTFKDFKLSICATTQTDRNLNQAGFEALTFIEAGKIVTHPALSVDETNVSQNYTTGLGIHMKGAKIGMSTEVVFGPDDADTGQAAFETASRTRFWYAIKQEWSNAPSATTTNTIVYCLVQVRRGATNGGGVDDPVVITYPLDVQSDPIIVDPEAI
jgi:hypothetical protein